MPSKKSSKPKAKKTTASKQTVVEKPVVETPVVETPVVETVIAETTTEDESYDSEFAEINEQLRMAMATIKSLVGTVSRLEKRVSRDRKVMNKKMRGRVKKVVDPNKPPSGFAKPGPVSDELRKFLSLGKDELIARTEVTKRITQYCRDNNLQKAEDKRSIEVNAPLKKLLRMKAGDELTFFNLQKYMKVHYPNKDGVYIHN
jgi:chromatin remodeling complex protein RSC6